MPAIKPRKGASKKTKRAAASKNISTNIREGLPKKQAIAKGLSQAGIAKARGTKKTGHRTGHKTGHRTGHMQRKK